MAKYWGTPPFSPKFLAPSGAQGVTLSVRLFSTSLSKTMNLHLITVIGLSQICHGSVSDLSQVSLGSVSGQSRVSLGSVSGQSRVSLGSVTFVTFFFEGVPKLKRGENRFTQATDIRIN